MLRYATGTRMNKATLKILDDVETIIRLWPNDQS
jgi:hypothetical protein